MFFESEYKGCCVVPSRTINLARFTRGKSGDLTIHKAIELPYLLRFLFGNLLYLLYEENAVGAYKNKYFSGQQFHSHSQSLQCIKSIL